MEYKIICAQQQSAKNNPEHNHVVSVGVKEPDKQTIKNFTKDRVISKILDGHSFIIQNIQTEETTLVEYYWCSQCHSNHIRTRLNSHPANDLAQLPSC